MTDLRTGVIRDGGRVLVLILTYFGFLAFGETLDVVFVPHEGNDSQARRDHCQELIADKPMRYQRRGD